MNKTLTNGYGTMVYFITGKYQPPEVKQAYLDSLIRKLKRNGLADLLPNHMQDQGLDYKFNDLLTSTDIGDEHNEMHDDLHVPFFLRMDLPESELTEKIKPLADYARTRGFNHVILEVPDFEKEDVLSTLAYRKLIFTNVQYLGTAEMLRQMQGANKPEGGEIQDA
jgi:hypothetical protein